MDESFEIIDDGQLVIHSTRWGTYSARDSEGNGLCCGLDRESVIYWAREHLNGFQTSTYTVTKTKFGDGYKL